jgi:pyruvate/2-oxoglutarate dehydrogenase complex dihydrolipoamide dehydrogenase (E3) component
LIAAKSFLSHAVDERKKMNNMSEPERYDVLVLGNGTARKLTTWTMAREGKRTASIERKYVGGACPNVACLPSKNIIHTAKVVSLFGRHQEFGIETGPIAFNMVGVYARKRRMVRGLVVGRLRAVDPGRVFRRQLRPSRC